MSVTTPGFIDKQVEKLEAFQKSNGINIENKIEEKNETLENEIKDVVKDLANKGVKSLSESVANTEDRDSSEDLSEEIKPEKTVEKRIDLDKNTKKEDSAKKEIDEESKSHLDWLNEKDDSNKEVKETPNYEEEIKTYKSKVQEYESILNDDLVKAVSEFRKNGGTDLSELNKQLGFTDVNSITINDYYNQKAIDAGLKGEELAEAVEEAVDRYNSLPKLDQKEILNNFQNTFKKKTEEKLKSFSTKTQELRQEHEKIQKSAFAELENEVKDKIGKKWRGLLIDEKMGKELLQIAPNYAFPKTDENGRIIGYDSKHGVEMAIYAKFGKKLLKAQYDLARISSYDEVIKERNRPSENMTSNQIVVTAPNDIEKVTKEWRDEKKKQGLGVNRPK